MPPTRSEAVKEEIDYIQHITNQSFAYTMIEKIQLAEKLKKIEHYWDPKIVGQLNGQQVKLARFKGTFDWHKHDREDEMFLVLEGSFELDLRERSLHLEAGEMVIVPGGTLHRPRAEQEASVMLFEPASTLNTGNVRSGRTVDQPDEI